MFNILSELAKLATKVAPEVIDFIFGNDNP